MRIGKLELVTIQRKCRGSNANLASSQCSTLQTLYTVYIIVFVLYRQHILPIDSANHRDGQAELSTNRWHEVIIKIAQQS